MITKAITSTTNTELFTSNGYPTTVGIYGTWGGTTAKLQASLDGGTTYADIKDASFTADGVVSVFLTSTVKCRVNTTGGSSINLTAAWCCSIC